MGINMGKSQKTNQGHTGSEHFWSPNEIHTIHLGLMLAKVIIVPENTNHVAMRLHSGSEELFNKLRATVRSGKLSITCDLPYKTGAAGGALRGMFSRNHGNIHVSGSGIVVSGSGDIHVSGGNIHIGGGRRGSSVMIIDGREVDLSKKLEIGLIVPINTNVEVDELIGDTIISRNLGGRLQLAIKSKSTVNAQAVGVLSGFVSGHGDVAIGAVAGDCDFSLGGQGDCTIGAVAGNATVELSGQGECELSSVAGRFNSRVSGQGSIKVKGGVSTSMEGRVSGQGSISHRGAITGDARLQVSGMGDIRVARVNGRVEPRVSGLGKIIANGRTYGR